MYEEAGGPVFPVQKSSEFNNQHNVYAQTGMTLRDYFAAAAITGLMSRHGNTGSNADNAEVAYSLADEMLLARES